MQFWDKKIMNIAYSKTDAVEENRRISDRRFSDVLCDRAYMPEILFGHI